MEKRIINTELSSNEESVMENKLRPSRLTEYIGQDKVKNNLKVYIEAAKSRKESLDHVLFYGPPGLGKTTLACIIAEEMGVNIKITSGPAIEKPGEMAAILNNLREGDVLFIDEIGELDDILQNKLLKVLEDKRVEFSSSYYDPDDENIPEYIRYSLTYIPYKSLLTF